LHQGTVLNGFFVLYATLIGVRQPDPWECECDKLR